MVGVSGNRVLQSAVAATAVICLTISVHVILSQSSKVGFTGSQFLTYEPRVVHSPLMSLPIQRLWLMLCAPSLLNKAYF